MLQKTLLLMFTSWFWELHIDIDGRVTTHYVPAARNVLPYLVYRLLFLLPLSKYKT